MWGGARGSYVFFKDFVPNSDLKLLSIHLCFCYPQEGNSLWIGS